MQKKKLILTLIPIIIPLIILGYVLYMNFLPFGYEKTFVIDVGSEDSIDSSKEVYLVKNSALSEVIEENGEKFRYLNGTVELVINPKVNLDDKTKIEISSNIYSKKKVYLKYDKKYYPIGLGEMYEQTFEQKNIVIYGSPNNSKLLKELETKDESFFNTPKTYFTPKEDSEPIFKIKNLTINDNGDIIKIDSKEINEKIKNGFIIIADLKNDYIPYHGGIVYKEGSFLISAPYDSYRFTINDDKTKPNIIIQQNIEINKTNKLFIVFNDNRQELYYNLELSGFNLVNNSSFLYNNNSIFIGGRKNLYIYKGIIKNLEIFDPDDVIKNTIKKDSITLDGKYSSNFYIVSEESAHLNKIIVTIRK